MATNDKVKEHILLLFERPKEPVFMPKGENKTVFNMPDSYWVDRYQPLQSDLSNRFGEESTEQVNVKEVRIPDLKLPMSLGRQDNFSLFIKLHQQMATVLIEAFMAQKTLEDFLSLSVYAKDRINPYLYNYALSVAVLHRPDTRDLPVPSAVEVFPEKYMDSTILGQALEQSDIIRDNRNRIPLTIPRDYTASDLDEEHRVAYFREDLGLNLHHWHWHLVYPNSGPMSIVNKDRRGELFYYMHQQIMARYNFERFSNYLPRTKRLLNLRDPISEGYFPKLDSLVSSRVWPGRPPNAKLSDVNREKDQLYFDIADMERWRDRFYQAIHTGSVINTRGQTVPLDEQNGIDILGNMMEASPVLSINPFFYGDLHNNGHLILGLSHDPDNRHLETYGVIGDPATAMRDPVFYLWHAFVDDIFQEHKNLLPRYTEQQLGFNGVKVNSVEVNIKNQPKNLLITLWQQNDVDMSRGLDFTPRGNVFARFTHLQHGPFSYKIQVQNSGQPRMGTCRIFMAPKFDERGLPFLFRDQKILFIEMDKFTVNLRSGNNQIERQSRESSVVIPFEQTFRDLQTNRPTGGSSLEEFNFCGCGWPEHLLVPKGTAEGLLCELFVMISDYEGDKVDQGPSSSRTCKMNAASYCGLRDSKYPDKRSMGYPFDRMPRDGVNRLSEFLTPNMAVIDVTIRFTDRVLPPRPMNKSG